MRSPNWTRTVMTLATTGLLASALATGLAACGGSGGPPKTVSPVNVPPAHPVGSKFQIPSGLDGVPAIEVEVLQAGTGAPVTLGIRAKNHLVIQALEASKPLIDSRSAGKPRFTAAGLGAIQPGLDMILVQMRKGDRWKAVVPPPLMFGTNAGPNCPPNATFNVDFEVLDLLKE